MKRRVLIFQLALAAFIAGEAGSVAQPLGMTSGTRTAVLPKTALVLVGTEESSGKMKTVFYALDGTYQKTIYLTQSNGLPDMTVCGGATVIVDQTPKIAITDVSNNYIRIYRLDGTLETSVSTNYAEGKSRGLALGATPDGRTLEWAVGRRHWKGAHWQLAFNRQGAQVMNNLKNHPPVPGGLASAEVIGKHLGPEILWTSDNGKETLLDIRDTRLNTYGDIKEHVHRYSDVMGPALGGYAVFTVYGDLAAKHPGNEFAMISRDKDGYYWLDCYSADLKDYDSTGRYIGPVLDGVLLGQMDFRCTPPAGKWDQAYWVLAGGVIPNHPETLGLPEKIMREQAHLRQIQEGLKKYPQLTADPYIRMGLQIARRFLARVQTGGPDGMQGLSLLGKEFEPKFLLVNPTVVKREAARFARLQITEVEQVLNQTEELIRSRIKTGTGSVRVPQPVGGPVTIKDGVL